MSSSPDCYGSWQNCIREFATMPREENTSLEPPSIPSLFKLKWFDWRLYISIRSSWWKSSYCFFLLLFIRLSFSDNGKAIKPSPALRLAGLFHPLLSKPRFLWIKMLLSSFASLLRHSQHSPSIPRLLSLRRNPPIPYACLCFLDKSRLYGMNRLGALTTTGPVFQASRLLCRASSPSG